MPISTPPHPYRRAHPPGLRVGARRGKRGYYTGIIEIRSKGEARDYKDVKVDTKIALLMPILADTEINREKTKFSECVTVLKLEPALLEPV